MPNLAIALFALALQQRPPAAPVPADTAGSWQQRVHYTITATLDEGAQRVRARGTMRYVNNSPDTLRVLYFHQYLNAFRPHSRWSETDAREGRIRFQDLEEPHSGYERFTAPPTVNGVAARIEYPGAPDSTVVRLTLPAPLPPRDSVLVAFQWDARPSTLPRRQARRGRHWDLAQWYPKVAVYDKRGWQPNALRPAGEFYGEFGTYDVTLVVPLDQIVAATGVPVSGDPGWSRALRAGVVRPAADAYGPLPPSDVAAPGGRQRAIRFHARDVHHFAWTASPDYRYEGGVYARPAGGAAIPAWDTVSVHVLYRPGDDSTWGGLRAVRRTIAALQWLEAIYGRYPYPQLTAHHRIDGGGSETPMLMMNGSPSQGLILHEGGHMYTYGALANNEWREGWIDEGLTSYQTAWAQLLTPVERARAGIVDPVTPRRGYRSNAIQMSLPRFEIVSLNQALRDLHGLSQPMGTVAHEFRDFDTYTAMTYDRAEMTFSQLRDLLGDTVFVGFLNDFYARWALRHVDEGSLRGSAERASGRDLAWFFDQYVRRTGVMDYRLGSVRTSRDSGGTWTTLAEVRRRGEYAHAMPVGVRTASGWTIGRMTRPPYDRETVRVVTREPPLEVRLDPLHATWDWDRRNDVRRRALRHGVDWPFLAQADRDRGLSLWRPLAWYSRPGGISAGLQLRYSYLGVVDNLAMGGAYPPGPWGDKRKRIDLWVHRENPDLPFLSRPAMGWRWGVARHDDVVKAEMGRRRERELARSASLTDVSLNYAVTQGREFLPEAWLATAAAWTFDVDARTRLRRGSTEDGYGFLDGRLVAGTCGQCRFAKAEAALGVVRPFAASWRMAFRAFGAAQTSEGTYPATRALHVSVEDALATFGNHWWRPREAVLEQPRVNWLPLGGAALRGYHRDVTAARQLGGNAELSRRVALLRGDFGAAEVAGALFADGVYAGRGRELIDAGPGLRIAGQLFDQPLRLRLDLPVFVSDPALAIDRDTGRRGRFAFRWAITFTDIW